MKNFFLAVVAIFLVSVLAYGNAAAGELPLPNPVGAFEHGEIVRVKPTLKTRFLSHTPGESPELPALVSGHKEVAISKIDGRYTKNDLHCVSICIDEKQVGMITWWGANEFGEENYGYPFRDLEDAPPTLHINHEKQTVIYRKPYIASHGNQAVFSYGLRPLDQSRVQIAWDSGSQDNVSP